MNPYPSPVSKLLTLGDGSQMREWPNYLELGLGPEHIPDLIRMTGDEELNNADSESLVVWAPMHAWRALGQLRAQAAIEPLLRLLDRDEAEEDDWLMEELPQVFGMIGAAALPALTNYLADDSKALYHRIAAARGLEEIAKGHPESRAEGIAALVRQLGRFVDNDPTLNGFLISSLTDLKAVEAAPLMGQAFAAECVDEFIMGDWEDVQVELGLKAPSERPPKQQINPIGGWDFLAASPEESLAYRQERARQNAAHRKAKAKAKAKRKQAEKSRKRNRRKRK